MALYACSDIHGQYSLFQKMLDGISFSDKDTLFIVGDIIDRGPDSIPMLQDIMNRKNVIRRTVQDPEIYIGHVSSV